MPRPSPSPWSRSVSSRWTRRHVIAAGASVLMLDSRPGAHAQGTIEQHPHNPDPDPSSGRDTSSWFVVSRPATTGYIAAASRLEVYDGRTYALLGGFPSRDMPAATVTADPGRILLDASSGLGIFDLPSGNVTTVAWDTASPVTTVRLPDPRWFASTPARWAFMTDDVNARALLVDLDNATGVDLAETLVRPGETAAYPTVRFSPDGARAIGSVAYNGFYLFDPEAPADARLLDGGQDDMISWGPDFSPDSTRLVYTLRELNGEPGPGTLVVENLAGGDVVEVGSVGDNGFAMFPPDSNAELLVFDEGSVSRIEIDGGRELWRAKSGAVALALGITGDVLFLGSARSRESTSAWQTIDLGTGEGRRLPTLRGLTYYNGSYAGEEPTFQLMGPVHNSGEDRFGPLAAVDLASGEVATLLDETSGWSITSAYGTSRDGAIVLYAPRYEDGFYVFDLASGERRAFTRRVTAESLYDTAVSPDGASAAFTHWNSSGSGRMEIRLIADVARDEPEPFMEGRLWVWAGDKPAPGADTTPKPASGQT